jgi:hypothetical protein
VERWGSRKGEMGMGKSGKGRECIVCGEMPMREEWSEEMARYGEVGWSAMEIQCQ